MPITGSGPELHVYYIILLDKMKTRKFQVLTRLFFLPLAFELKQTISATQILSKQNCFRQNNRLDVYSHV